MELECDALALVGAAESAEVEGPLVSYQVPSFWGSEVPLTRLELQVVAEGDRGVTREGIRCRDSSRMEEVREMLRKVEKMVGKQTREVADLVGISYVAAKKDVSGTFSKIMKDGERVLECEGIFRKRGG